MGKSGDRYNFLSLLLHNGRRRSTSFTAILGFLTTPGYLTGPGTREAAGLPPGTGPYRVITDLA
jgi:glutaconate CoA-transferase subunit B